MKKNIILYREIAEEIKKRILSGVYPVGSYIPSEIALETSFKVSKITVRQAVSLLVSEGYLEKHRGKGTVVISNQLFNRLSRAKSFSAILKETEFRITKEILEISTVSPEDPVAQAYHFDQGMTYVKRIYRLDDIPYILHQHYLRGVTEHDCLTLDKVSLYQLLKENQQVVVSFDDTFSVAELTTEEQSLFSTRSKACFGRTRKAFSNTGQLVELSLGFYNTEVFPYEIKYEV